MSLSAKHLASKFCTSYIWKLLTLPFLTRVRYILSGKDVYRASHEPSPVPQTPVNTQDTWVLCLYKHKTTQETCPKISEHTMSFRDEVWFLITVIGCHLLALEKWRPHWVSELQLLPREEEGAGPSPKGQRSPGPLGPSAASETYRHRELHDTSPTMSTSFWWVLFTWPVLGVRSVGTVHQGWWAHSCVHQNRKPSSQKYFSVLSASITLHTTGRKQSVLCQCKAHRWKKIWIYAILVLT